MTLLRAEHISKSFTHGMIRKKTRPVLHDISFSIGEGEMMGLAGTSGAGKTTLIRILMGLLPAEGQIFFEGKRLSMNARSREERQVMQLLFQNPGSALNPRMTIEESLREPLRIHQLDREDEIPGILEELQLRNELLHRYPGQLSGGELQRICLGRLLLLRPRLLLLDEPTSMLDVSVQAQIVRILQRIQKRRGMACLFISHALDLLKACCTRIGILHEGRLIEMQRTEDLYKHPKEVYTRSLIDVFENF